MRWTDERIKVRLSLEEDLAKMNEVERQIKARDVETAAVVDALQKQIGRWSEQIYDYVNENEVP